MVTVYTLPSCVQCDSTKRYLKRNLIEYTEIDISKDKVAYSKVKEMGYEICYGHTDSIYIKIESVDKAKEVCSIINEFIQTEIYPNDMGLEEHPVVLEFEKHYRSLGVGTVMNRNAGFIQWKEGLGYLSEPEFFATGFVMKRRKESELAKEDVGKRSTRRRSR